MLKFILEDHWFKVWKWEFCVGLGKFPDYFNWWPVFTKGIPGVVFHWEWMFFDVMRYK